ncbi:DMT family transporter [Leptolyngbya ohadii]|uniref:DMT family transporter n=1 Tax=Leptolyngbya ohadii TaxID=1962290 RepID=UPI000B5A11DE|nr:DMT family transporter [Leptolyngbya ohadii]
MYTLLSSFIGALLAVMVFLNGLLANQIGNAASSTFIHLTGLILVTLILLVTQPKFPARKPIPPLLLSGGVLGCLTVVCANAGFSRLRVSLTLALSLFGQTISSLAIDHWGWLEMPTVAFDRRKIGSLALVLLGIVVMIYTDGI